MLKATIHFPNFGPYHLARLRALANLLDSVGGRLIAYEMAGSQRLYPWKVRKEDEPFEWITFFPDHTLEQLPDLAYARSMCHALERDRPDHLLICGYSTKEALATLNFANRRGRPAVLMCESQERDFRRTWWKEAIKRHRVTRFDAALVGGPRHRDYLISLGLDPRRVALGYDVVDNDFYAGLADRARTSPEGRVDLPDRAYFLAVSRFDPKKNLPGLIRAFAKYRARTPGSRAWDLVLCGGGPEEKAVEAAIARSGVAISIHRPGFLQADGLAKWYAFASAFVLPSTTEQWGLVVNEAAACGLPLLVSDRAGCVETLVPDPPGTTGRRFNPSDEAELVEALAWMADLPEAERAAMGRRAAEVVSRWGPDRFAQGALEALGFASSSLGIEFPPVHDRVPAATSPDDEMTRKVPSSSFAIGLRYMRSRHAAPRTCSPGRPSVLVVQRILPPYRLALFEKLGRSGSFTIELAYGQAAPGSSLVSIASPPGLKSYHLKNHFLPPHDAVLYQMGLSRLMKTHRWDTIIAEFNPRFLSILSTFFRSRRLETRFIWWGHGIRPHSSALARRIYLYLAKWADAVIFYSGQGADKMVEMGLPREKAFVAWNSIDVEPINRLVSPWQGAPRPHILCIGRLIAEKKVTLLVEAFARACPHLDPETKLVLIGDGPERGPVARLVELKRISSRVELVGCVYEEEKLAPWFNASCLSVAPGYLGLNAIHSLAYGLPMLVADGEPHSPEIAAIEDGVNALYFRANDPDHLAERIVEMSRDRGRLATMSIAARATVRERFSNEAMVHVFEDAVRFVHRNAVGNVLS